MEFFIYDWKSSQTATGMAIRAYGLDHKNSNVCLHIDGFKPYMYLELPIHIDWKNPFFFQSLEKQILKRMDYDTVYKLTVQYKYSLYYANMDEKMKRRLVPYLKCEFNKDVRHVMEFANKRPWYLLGEKIKLIPHENRSPIILQLTSVLKIRATSWVSVACKIAITKETSCTHEYRCDYRDIKKLDSLDTVAPLIVAYDIETNSNNIYRFPNPNKPLDVAFQISYVKFRYGEDVCQKYLLTLGNPDQKTVGNDVIIQRYDSERQLINGFTRRLRVDKPNIVTGYNISGFDNEYIIVRAELLDCFDRFSTHGFHNSIEINVVKKAKDRGSKQMNTYIEAEGIVYIDLFPLVQSNYKFPKYTLSYVSGHFLNNDKDDLNVGGIFRCYRNGINHTIKDGVKVYDTFAQKEMGTVGKYCIKDSVLVMDLFNHLCTWVWCGAMSKTCIAEGTFVTVGYSSHKIEHLDCIDEDVLSWGSDSVTFNRKSKLVSKGLQKCMVIKLMNGYILRCTPTHKILSEKIWKKTITLTPDDTVTTTLAYPKTSITQDMIQCMDYFVQLGHYSSVITDLKNYKILSILIRLVGYLTGDSHVYAYAGMCKAYIPDLDMKQFHQDIYTLTGVRIHSGNKLPDKLVQLLIGLSEYTRLGVSLDRETLPDFVCKADCPIPLVKEFIGGLFGCHATVSTGIYTGYEIRRDPTMFRGIRFTKQKNSTDDYDYLTNVKKLLLRFGIQSYTKLENKNTVCTLYMDYKNSIQFYHTVGFKYDTKKMYELYLLTLYEFPSVVFSRQNIKNLSIDIKIKSILPDIARYVYDIGVETNHSFVADSIIVHNCNIPMASILQSRQSIRVYSQVYTYCTSNNYVLQDNVYECDENERYVGACVLLPVPGCYKQMVQFDFASLYPSICIAYNMCHSTFVTDLNIPDSECHVIEWTDHSGCCHDPDIIKVAEYTVIINKGMAEQTRLRNIRDGKQMPDEKKDDTKVIEYTTIIQTVDSKIKPIQELKTKCNAEIKVKQSQSNGKTIIVRHEIKTLREKIKQLNVELRSLKQTKKVAKNKSKNLLNTSIKNIQKTLKPIRNLRAISTKVVKHVICGHRRYRFLRKPVGILPTILINLLHERKVTRVDIKHLKKFLATKRVTEKNKPVLETVLKTDLKLGEISVSPNSFKKCNDVINLLNKRQLEIKVSANSVYGATGMQKGFIAFMPIAMSVTAVGRHCLKKMKRILETDYKATVIYGDTDSNYCQFKHIKIGNLQELWEYCKYVEKGVSNHFLDPIRLEFEEEVYPEFLSIRKKGYQYSKCDINGVVDPEIHKKGVLTARRDNCEFARRIYGTMSTYKLVQMKSQDYILYYLCREFNKMYSYSYNTDDFIISKRCNNYSMTDQVEFEEDGVQKIKIGDYKLRVLSTDEKKRTKSLRNHNATTPREYYFKSLPAHVQLAMTMQKRGKYPSGGSRMQYILTQPNIKPRKEPNQYEIIEDVDYFKEHGDVLRVNIPLYMSKLVTPMDQVLNLLYKRCDTKTIEYTRCNYRSTPDEKCRSCTVAELKKENKNQKKRNICTPRRGCIHCRCFLKASYNRPGVLKTLCCKQHKTQDMIYIKNIQSGVHDFVKTQFIYRKIYSETLVELRQLSRPIIRV